MNQSTQFGLNTLIVNAYILCIGGNVKEFFRDFLKNLIPFGYL